MSENKPRILYFITSSVPTDDERNEAQKLGGKVVFRNARFASDADAGLEACDGVAGAVPACYRAAFPLATRAVARTSKAETAEAKQLATRVETPANLAATSNVGNSASWG